MIKSALLRCIGFLFKLVKSKPLNTETSLNLIHKSRNDRLNCYKILLQNKSNKNVNDEKTLLLMGKNVNLDIIQKLNEEFQDFRLGIQDSFQHVKANVAIAAAVTSYARMTMIYYKTLPNVKVFYSDTDSMFIDKPLPKHFIGEELGLMKDELKGNVISKAYFLGIKQYGFKYVDKNSNQTITKSVFAGIKRDSLTFYDIEQLACGNTLSRNVDVRFYKSFKDLNITVINDVKIDIKQNCSKLLFKNRYIPKHLINTIEFNFDYLFNFFESYQIRTGTVLIDN